MIVGGSSPIRKPDVRDVVGNEGQQSPQPGVADVENHQADDVQQRDHRTEDGGHSEITATAMREDHKGAGEALTGRRDPGQIASERPCVGHREEQEQDKEGNAAEDAGDATQEFGGEIDQLARAGLGDQSLNLTRVEPSVLQRLVDVVQEGLELRCVVLQQSGQLNPGNGQDEEQSGHDRVHRDKAQHSSHPAGQSVPGR